MALRYTTYPIQSSPAPTDVAESPQLLAALRNARLQTLKASVKDSWAKASIRFHGMDEETLGRLGGLVLGTHQKQPGEKARRNARRREAKAEEKEVTQESSIQKACFRQKAAEADLCNGPNQIPWYQSLPIQPPGSAPTVRSHKKAAIPHDVTVNAPRYQLGQGFVSPAQAPNPLQYQPTHGFAPYCGLLAQHYSDPRLKAQPFVPRGLPPSSGQSNVIPFDHGQKASLSTRAASANPTLLTRSGRWTGSPPPATQPFSSSNADSRGTDYKNKNSVSRPANASELIHLPAPKPTEEYIAKANTPAIHLPSPQTLLLVIDLNGTLLYRTAMTTDYIPRPGLEEFLEYCFANHSVLIWSSAKPHNVVGVCEKLFTPAQRGLLLGQWGRDTLGLTPKQYSQRVQVYKHLDTVWKNATIQCCHPNSTTGGRWGQHNTVLIDDSAMKAAAQPFNHVEVQEFVTAGEMAGDGKEILAQVVAMLEEVRGWNDVSAFVRARGGGGREESKE